MTRLLINRSILNEILRLKSKIYIEVTNTGINYVNVDIDMFSKSKFSALKNIADIENISPRDFEWFSKFLFEYLGFERVFVTKKYGELQADGGVDLTMFQNHEKIYVQCKKWRFGFRESFLPVRVIRELGGCMLRDKINRGIVVTTLEIDALSKFEAQKMNIAWIGKTELIEYMISINPVFNKKKKIGVFRRIINVVIVIIKFIFFER